MRIAKLCFVSLLIFYLNIPLFYSKNQLPEGRDEKVHVLTASVLCHALLHIVMLHTCTCIFSSAAHEVPLKGFHLKFMYAKRVEPHHLELSGQSSKWLIIKCKGNGFEFEKKNGNLK